MLQYRTFLLIQKTVNLVKFSFSFNIRNSKLNTLMSVGSLLRKAENRSYGDFNKEKESSWNGPFFFIQGADTQMGMIENYVLKLPNPTWEPEIKLVKATVAAVNAMTPKPRFFVVCGDLVDAFPGTSLRTAQENDFIRLFKELNPDIPLVCVCGNHDVGNKPTPETVQSYKDRFGDDYFTFYCAGVMFIVLNSQYFADPSLVEELAQEQEKWLDEQLEEAKSGKYKHVIVFQHIPYFLKTFDEQDHYFCLPMEIRMKILHKLQEANVNAVFCGHWHGNAGGYFKNMEVVTTSAIGAQLRGDTSGLRVVIVGENNIKHEYYPLDQVPQKIDLN